MGHFHHILTGVGAGVAVFGVVDASQISAWGGAILALAAAAWGFWRTQRKEDANELLNEQLRKAIVMAKVKAVQEGKPDPYPAWMPLDPRETR